MNNNKINWFPIALIILAIVCIASSIIFEHRLDFIYGIILLLWALFEQRVSTLEKSLKGGKI